MVDDPLPTVGARATHIHRRRCCYFQNFIIVDKT